MTRRLVQAAKPRVPPATVTVPRDLAERTLALLMGVPVSQAYLVVRDWDKAVPGLIQPLPPP